MFTILMSHMLSTPVYILMLHPFCLAEIFGMIGHTVLCKNVKFTKIGLE